MFPVAERAAETRYRASQNPKLTWLALGRDHTDGSRKAKQRIALCRSRSLRNPFWGSPQQNFCLRQLAFAPLSTFVRMTAAPRFFVDCIKNRASHPAYLLGLLALIKCSICSYTADTVYVDQRVYIICQTIFQILPLACCSLLSPGRCCGGFALVLYAATLIDFANRAHPVGTCFATQIRTCRIHPCGRGNEVTNDALRRCFIC